MTCPLADVVIVTEHVPCERVHVAEPNETEPLPLWDQLTVPVGEYPVTVAVQVIVVEEPAAADFGAQETDVFVSMLLYNSGRRQTTNRVLMIDIFVGLCAGFVTELSSRSAGLERLP